MSALFSYLFTIRYFTWATVIICGVIVLLWKIGLWDTPIVSNIVALVPSLTMGATLASRLPVLLQSECNSLLPGFMTQIRKVLSISYVLLIAVPALLWTGPVEEQLMMATLLGYYCLCFAIGVYQPFVGWANLVLMVALVVMNQLVNVADSVLSNLPLISALTLVSLCVLIVNVHKLRLSEEKLAKYRSMNAFGVGTEGATACSSGSSDEKESFRVKMNLWPLRARLKQAQNLSVQDSLQVCTRDSQSFGLGFYFYQIVFLVLFALTSFTFWKSNVSFISGMVSGFSILLAIVTAGIFENFSRFKTRIFNHLMFPSVGRGREIENQVLSVIAKRMMPAFVLMMGFPILGMATQIWSVSGSLWFLGAVIVTFLNCFAAMMALLILMKPGILTVVAIMLVSLLSLIPGSRLMMSNTPSDWAVYLLVANLVIVLPVLPLAVSYWRKNYFPAGKRQVGKTDKQLSGV